VILIEAAVKINAPIEKVWRTFTDLTCWAGWCSVIYDVSCSITPAIEQGRSFDFSIRPFVIPLRVRPEISEVIENKKVVWRGRKFTMRIVHEFLFEEKDGAVVVTSLESMKGPIVSIFGFMLPHKRLTSITEKMLNELKRATEGLAA